MSTLKSSAEDLTLNADGSGNDVIIQSDGSTVVTVDGSGNLGIGTGTIANESDHKKLKIAGGSGTGAGMIEFADTSNNIDGAVFADGGNLFIVADRDNATATSSIRFRVDGSSERARITTDGLTFNGDTAAANALDDYEEGSWTPVVAGTSSAGSYTYAYNDGRYTKVGNLVTLWCNIGNVATGSAGSGNLSVTGMPFATASGIGYYQACVLSNWNSAGGPMTYVGASSSTIYFETYPDSTGGGSSVAITDKTSNGADVRFQFCYRT